jgi:mannitol/fructose-specific phosphotransferase system IIA component (Ntr-type)
MKLSKFCDERLVAFGLKAATKDEAIEELVTLAATSNMIKDERQLLADVREREELVTTGVGYGVAFPHAKTRSAKGIVIAFGRQRQGCRIQTPLDLKTGAAVFPDSQPPEDAFGAHLNVMAHCPT